MPSMILLVFEIVLCWTQVFEGKVLHKQFESLVHIGGTQCYPLENNIE